MRHGSSNNRRHRNNRGNGARRSGGGSNKTQVFDSNGPDVRIRGTAFQVCEKYLALAKDSQSAGDLILWQSYLQHAEHYQRLINSWVEEETYEDEGEDGVESQNFNAERRPHQNRPQPQQQQHQRRDNRENNSSAPAESRENDLSLPTSILGGFSKPSPQKQSEMESS